jgi:EAL domain-containing protein (putative c-di-GMP-specific phosphodiesterase class I)
VEQERTAIVEAIIGMARALSLDAIAVGVESDIQLAELRRIGCDYGQGHLFSRPLPAADITRLIRDGELELLGNSAR